MSGEKIYRKPSRCGESGKESLTEEYGKGIPSRSRRFGIFVLMLALLIFQVTIFVYEKFSQNEDSVVVGSSQPLVKDVPFVFNPNTITLDSLCMLGLSPRQAQTIINYRSKGGRFRRPEDFSRMYVVSEELFLRLRVAVCKFTRRAVCRLGYRAFIVEVYFVLRQKINVSVIKLVCGNKVVALVVKHAADDTDEVAYLFYLQRLAEHVDYYDP